MKRKNSFIGDLLFLIILIVGSLFIYLLTINEIRMLNNTKDNLETVLKEKSNRREMLLVEIQRLSAEDRVVTLAADSIGLVRSNEVYESIIIDEIQLQRVKNIVNRKYE